MLKACTLVVIASVLGGCVARATPWKREIAWPDEDDVQLAAPSMEAGAALAAAAGVREMIRQNPYPDLFWGCSSPEQGLNVTVFKEPKSGLFFVVIHERFDRCGGSSGRVLDARYEYAVTAQGEVVAEAPPMAGEAPRASPPTASPPSPEQPSPPADPPPATDPGTSVPPPPAPPPPPPTPAAQPPASGVGTPAQAPPPAPSSAPSIAPPASPAPGSPPPGPPG
jgi:hypothetical protein